MGSNLVASSLDTNNLRSTADFKQEMFQNSLLQNPSHKKTKKKRKMNEAKNSSCCAEKPCSIF